MGVSFSGNGVPFREEDVESSTGSHRTRFVEDGKEEGSLHYATLHVGFLRNEHKGTTNNHFIPPEYHQTMAQMENERDGMSYATPSGSDSLSFCRDSEYHKARERYRQFTRKGAGPFSRIYNFGRDFIAGNMMKDWTFKHCEIAFDRSMFPRAALAPVKGIAYGPDCLVAFGTNMKDGEIFRKPRTFKPKKKSTSSEHEARSARSFGGSNEEEPYEWIHLRLPREVVQRAITLANQEIGKEYDTKPLEHMLTSPMALKPSSQWSVQKWHCTNFTVHILQQVGFLNGMDPNCLTADDVYYYLKDNIHESKLFITPAAQCQNAQRIRQELNKAYAEY